MTCTEEYQERIEYTFQAFCKVVIRNAMYTALRTRSRKNKREISLDYLTEEKHYSLGTEDEYFIVPEPDEQYMLILCGDTVLFDNGLLLEALSRLPEQDREMVSHSVFLLLVRGHHTQKGGLPTMKRYNTLHRSRVVKTRMTEEELLHFFP